VATGRRADGWGGRRDGRDGRDGRGGRGGRGFCGGCLDGGSQGFAFFVAPGFGFFGAPGWTLLCSGPNAPRVWLRAEGPVRSTGQI
jgi:hypothetical protein